MSVTLFAVLPAPSTLVDPLVDCLLDLSAVKVSQQESAFPGTSLVRGLRGTCLA